MAKKSMIARDVKRKKLVERYAAKRKTLIDAFKSAKDPMERLEIHRKIQALPRNCAPNRIKIRCGATGNPRGVIEILVFAEINLEPELIMANYLEL